MKFVDEHLLSVDQLARADLMKIFTVADSMLPYARRQRKTRVLEGAILCSLFLEASTRTRLSFSTAFNLLGGTVRETVDTSSTSLVKGESLADFARVISGYSDVIVIRHPEVGAVADFAESSRSPVINGGDGGNEHPTQAILDLYTIRKELAVHGKKLDGLRLAVVGDLKYGRAAHSLLKLLREIRNVTVHLIAPSELAAPKSVIAELKAAGHTIRKLKRLASGIKGVDAVYMTRIQEERFSCTEVAAKFRGQMRLNQALYKENCEPHTIIMHPLPRDSRADAQELNTDLNENPNLAIFRQADYGLAVRMALFALILDVGNRIDTYSSPISWRSNPSKWD